MTDDPRPLPEPVVDTAAAALNITPARLERWAQAGIIAPRHVDPDGDSWWNMRDLRRQIADALDGHDEEM